MGLKGLAKFLLLFLAIGVACIYIFIPSPIKVSQQIKIKGSEKNLYLLLSNNNNWKLWLDKDPVNSTFNYNFSKNIYPTIFIEANNSNNKIPIEIEILDASKSDSSIVFWHCVIPAGITPWSRIQHYMAASDLKNDFSKVMKNITDYASETTNLYGINIVETNLKDTLIATLNKLELNPPSDALLCNMINDLRQQIKQSGSWVTDSPMTTIRQDENGKFKLMVGFPIDKIPAPDSRLNIKKMIPGKLLTGTVYGGPAAINKAHVQMRKYIMDHDKEEVALPFETSVVNKCLEPDTSKWITKLCYPVY